MTYLETCSSNIQASRNAFMDLFRKEFVFPGIARHRPPKEAEGDDEEGDGDGDGDDE